MGRSRRYTKIVEFWQITEVADGYGGNLPNLEVLVAKSWAKISTFGTGKGSFNSSAKDLGITDALNTIVVSLRNRKDISYNTINQYIKYNGNKYIIKSVTNTDLLDVDIEIIATKEVINSVPVITPVGARTFDSTFDLTFN